MTERHAGRKNTREATRDGSRGKRASGADFRSAIGAAGPLGWATLALGLAAAALMIAVEFTTLFSVDIGIGDCEDLARERRDECLATGGEQHSYGFILLALLALPMAFGAGVGGSRPAAGALIFIGAVVLAIALFSDLPDTNEAGPLAETYGREAKASAGVGLYLEIVGGLLAVAAGSLRLMEREPSGQAEAAKAPWLSDQ